MTADQPPAPGSRFAAAMGDEVSPVELLFDLVFAFAISQLSHHLLEHLTWRGAGETAVLLLAVFGIWALVSFGASMPGVTRTAEVTALFSVMVLGMLFNAGIPTAFEGQPWLFVVPFLVCNVGVAVFYMIVATAPVMRTHGQSMLVWAVPSTALWILGALAAPEIRLVWWGAAALIDVVGAWSAHRLPGRRFHTERVPFAPAHMIERSRLFLIIALGETVLTTGGSLASTQADVPRVVAAIVAVGGTTALWALYFAGSDSLVNEHASSTGDPLRAARLAVNGQVVTAAGLIVVAVGYELAIDVPLEQTSPVLALLLFGGPVLYLGLQIWYLCTLTGRLPRSRVVGAVAMVVAGAGCTLMAALPALVVSSGILLATAVWAARAVRRLDPTEPVSS